MNRPDLTAPHLLITASAGTGKTMQLARRYLRTLLDPATATTPDRLLAVTFTRKAAGEIFERIIRELLKASEDQEYCEKLAADIQLPGLTPSALIATLERLLVSLHRVRVSTLDSFFATVGRCFATELNLPLSWSIVEDSRAEELELKALATALAQLEAAAAAELFSGALGGRDNRAVAQPLRNFLAIYGPLVDEAPLEVWGAGLDHLGSELDEAGLTAAVATLAAAEIPKNKRGDEDARWRSRVDSDLKLVEAGDWSGFLASVLAQKVWSGKQEEKKPTFAGKPLSSSLAEAYVPLVAHALAKITTELTERARRIRALVLMFRQHWQEVQRQHAAYRFHDLPEHIAAAGSGLAPAELFYRLDSRIDHLLLDEFQDTSLLQWRALRALVAEVAAGGAAGRSFFAVGDPKQAIYGWRGGVHELCRAETLAAEVPALGDLVSASLTHNYRSAPEVLCLVNELFLGNGELPEALKNNPAFVAAWSAFTAKEVFPYHQAQKQALPGYACVLEVPVADNDENQATVETIPDEDATALEDPRLYQAACWILDQACGPLAGWEIGVLVRSNSALHQLVHHLKVRARRTNAAIEISEEGSSPVRDGVAASVLISALRLADHPGDTAAAFHVLHSKLGAPVAERYLKGTQVGDDLAAQAQELSRKLRRCIAVAGVSGLITELAELAGWFLPAALPEREAQRLEQLLAAAYAFDARGGSLRPAAFVREVEALECESPRSAQIRVMTIHQAKGLDFDVVVLPELWPRLWRRSVGEPWVWRDGHKPFGRVRAVLPPLPKALHPYLGKDLLAVPQAAEVRGYYEALSLLYVALTRARRATYALIFTSQQRKDQATFAELLRKRLAPGPVNPETANPETTRENCSVWTPIAAWGRSDWAATATRDRVSAEPASDTSDTRLRLSPAPAGFLALSAAPARLGHVTPSQLAQAQVSPAKLLALDRSALEYGSAIHACFEQVAWLDEGAPDVAVVTAALTAAGLSGPRVAEVAADFTAMLARPAVAALLKRTAYTGRGGAWADAIRLDVYCERRFAMRYDGCTLSGAIDRLVIARDAAGNALAAEVLDFKTDRIDDATAMADAVERYRPQLVAYRAAAARIARLDKVQVTAKLVFVEMGRVVDVDG